MSSRANALRVTDLSRQKTAALKRKAGGLGLSPEQYIKQLIEDDLALDMRARSTSLEELAAPFRKALRGVSDADIDRIVEKARRPAGGARRRG